MTPHAATWTSPFAAHDEKDRSHLLTNRDVVMIGRQGLQAPPSEDSYGPSRIRSQVRSDGAHVLDIHIFFSVIRLLTREEEATVQSRTEAVGSVVLLWRYPVKSMIGEELNASEVTERGLLGDRAYALLDPTTGKVVSAKNPRKWRRMFEFRAAFVDPPQLDRPLPPVRITCPEGTTTASDGGDVEPLLSKNLDRSVRLMVSAPETPSLEEYWPDIEGLAHREKVTDELMPSRTFFDLAVLHVLTTTTLDRLRQLYPEGRFDVRRFRPNIVVEPTSGAGGFPEDGWIGKTLNIGHQVRIRVTGPCPRCVMTTLPQGDLPRDPGILRTAAKHHQVNVGVYASVVRGGMIRRGDPVAVE